MFDRAALGAFNRTLTVNTARLTAEASSALLAKTAAAERDRVLREQGGRGSPPTYRQIVDGIEGAALEGVRPDGVIVFEWQYLRDVVEQVYQMLVDRSPRDSGDYIASIKVLVDDREATMDAIGPDTRVVVIVPTVPYARRLEVGTREAGGPFVLQVRPHIVEETHIAAMRLFRGQAFVGFGYTDLDNAYSIRGPRGKPKVGRRYLISGEVRYPAIFIERLGG